MTKRGDFEIWRDHIRKYIGPYTEDTLAIPEGITHIESGAFSGHERQFRSAVIPESMTSLADEAFRDFVNLRELRGAEHLEKIGYCAFENTAIEEIDLPCLEDLGHRAFCGCKNLKRVRLSPGKLSMLPKEAFARCPSLRELTVPEGVWLMDDDVFSMTPLAVLYLPKSLIRIDWQLAFSSVKKIVVNPENPRYYVKGGKLLEHPYHEPEGPYTVLESPTEYDLIRCDYYRWAHLDYADPEAPLRLRRVACGPEEKRRAAEECKRYAFRVVIRHIEGNDDYDREEVSSVREELEDVVLSQAVLRKGELIGFTCRDKVVRKDDFDSVVRDTGNYVSTSYYNYEKDSFTYRLCLREEPTKGAR